MSSCPICKPDPEPILPDFITPVRLGSTRHRSSCPTLPHLSLEKEASLRADLAEMDRVRRRGAFEAQFIMIGGG